MPSSSADLVEGAHNRSKRIIALSELATDLIFRAFLSRKRHKINGGAKFTK